MQNQKHLTPAGKLYSIWPYWKKSDLNKASQTARIREIKLRAADFNSFCKQKVSAIPETFIEFQDFFGYTGNK